MKKILLIAMVLIATANTKAQEKKIKGRVVEQLQDGSAVSYKHLTLPTSDLV